MRALEASKLLRPGLLDGVCMLLAGASGSDGPNGTLAPAVREACERLGARVFASPPPFPTPPVAGAEEQELARVVAAALAAAGSVELLVVDAAGLFAHAGGDARKGGEAGARAALRASLDGAWLAVRAAAEVAFIPAQAGRIVLLSPAPGAGEHAEAARAGLENLSRTLSIEWARHGITAVTLAPGAQTSAGEVAALCAYLASPAGAYFSGCLLDLTGPAAAASARHPAEGAAGDVEGLPVDVVRPR